MEIQENVDNEFKIYCRKPGCFRCNPDTAETQAEDGGISMAFLDIPLGTHISPATY